MMMIAESREKKGMFPACVESVHDDSERMAISVMILVQKV